MNMVASGGICRASVSTHKNKRNKRTLGEFYLRNHSNGQCSREDMKITLLRIFSAFCNHFQHSYLVFNQNLSDTFTPISRPSSSYDNAHKSFHLILFLHHST